MRGPVTEIHGHIADRVTGEPTVRATARFHALRRKGTACACVEGLFDPLADDIFLAVDAVQVDLVQDAGAVAGPCGDLCGRVRRVQPQGQGGMPHVVWTPGERGDGQFRAQRGQAGCVPGAAVVRFAEYAAAGGSDASAPRAGKWHGED